MNYKKLFIFSLLAFIFFPSCELRVDNLFIASNSCVDNRTDSFPTIALENPSLVEKDEFEVYVISDTHCSEYGGNLEKLIQFLSQMPEEKRPAFCVNLGDVVDKGNIEEYQAYNIFVNKLKELNIEHYAVPGNHDCFDAGNCGLNFKDYLYPHETCFVITSNNFSYYFLDTGDGTLGQRQYEYFSRKVKSDNKNKIIFTHYPFYYPKEVIYKISNPNERLSLLDLCEKNNVKYILCGHVHRSFDKDFGDFKEELLVDFRTFPQVYILHFDNKNKTITSYIQNF